MAYADDLYKKNFLEYASYVIRERAIPEIEDGFKPVQRRIMHTLFTLDDGKFIKVAGVVGEAMKYHPHGDSSIYDALVNLANSEIFIEKQGNFGNFLTGDGAAAARYIECRLKPFAKKVLYSPEITEYVDSYDGKHKEPVVFPAKIPVAIIQGTQGIAVTMSTNILPHNLFEVLEAEKKVLKGEPFELYPDFPGGGVMDVSQYADGTGKVTVRAKINAEDPKKIVIEELPYGVTTEKMIQSIENANKNGQLKIAQINDFTSNKASIEIAWQRNTYSKDMIDVLYATTDCEIKISVNPLVIKGGLPHIVPISEQVRYHAHHLIDVLEKELRYQRGEEEEKLKARTLERIFIEERVYKKIENVKTSEGVKNAIIKGMDPFIKETSYHPLSDDDIERLLKIPIRRISLFDIEKNRKEIEEINARIGQIDYNLTHIVEYAIDTLDDIEASADQNLRKRNTEISAFESLSAKEVAVRNLDLRYDKETGYIGTSLKTGEVLLKVSTFDKFFYMKANGEYRVTNVSDKEFIGTEGLLYFNYGEKDVISKEVFTVIYTEKSEEKGRSLCYIKRFQIPSFTLGKLYSILKRPKAKIRKLYLFDNAMITLKYKKGFGYRQLEEVRYFADFRVQKNANGQGLLLTAKEVEKFNIREMKKNTDSSSAEPDLFKE